MEARSADELVEEIDWREACRTQTNFDGGALWATFLGAHSSSDTSRLIKSGPYIFVWSRSLIYRYGPNFDRRSAESVLISEVEGILSYTVLGEGRFVYVVTALETLVFDLSFDEPREISREPSGSSICFLDRLLPDVIYEVQGLDVRRVVVPLSDWMRGVPGAVRRYTMVTLAAGSGSIVSYTQANTLFCLLENLGVAHVVQKEPASVVTVVKDLGNFYTADCTDTLLVFGSHGQKVTGIDLPGGSTRFSVSSCQFSLNSLHLSPAGFTITNSGSTGTVRSPDTGKELVTLKGHTSWVQLVRHDPRCEVVVTGSNDNSVRVWDAATGQQKHKTVLDSELKAVLIDGRRMFVLTSAALWLLEHDGSMQPADADARALSEVEHMKA
jgi:WD40 repeat protein